MDLIIFMREGKRFSKINNNENQDTLRYNRFNNKEEIVREDKNHYLIRIEEEGWLSKY